MQNRLFGLPLSLVVALMVILGALFNREFFFIGKWVVVVALVLYVAYNLKFAIWVAKTVKKREMNDISLAVIVAIFLVTAISIIFSNKIPFFLIIFFLACDYLIKDKKR